MTAVPATGLTLTIGTTAAAVIADNDYIVRANVAGVSDISGTELREGADGPPRARR